MVSHEGFPHSPQPLREVKIPSRRLELAAEDERVIRHYLDLFKSLNKLVNWRNEPQAVRVLTEVLSNESIRHLIIMGPPASGKTTILVHLHRIFEDLGFRIEVVTFDAVRKYLIETSNKHTTEWNGEDWKRISEVLLKQALEAEERLVSTQAEGRAIVLTELVGFGVDIRERGFEFVSQMAAKSPDALLVIALARNFGLQQRAMAQREVLKVFQLLQLTELSKELTRKVLDFLLKAGLDLRIEEQLFTKKNYLRSLAEIVSGMADSRFISILSHELDKLIQEWLSSLSEEERKTFDKMILEHTHFLKDYIGDDENTALVLRNFKYWEERLARLENVPLQRLIVGICLAYTDEPLKVPLVSVLGDIDKH